MGKNNDNTMWNVLRVFLSATGILNSLLLDISFILDSCGKFLLGQKLIYSAISINFCVGENRTLMQFCM
jgi:hypothetical protein